MAINSGDKQMAPKLQNEFMQQILMVLSYFMNFSQNARASYYTSERLKHQSYFLKLDLYKPKEVM